MPLDIGRNRNMLNGLRVAHPCGKTWDSMNGDDRTRHCDNCNRDVVNLSDCTRAEVRLLLDTATSATCVRFDSNLDGSIITSTRLGRVGTIVRRVASAAVAMMLGAVFATHAQTGAIASSDDPATKQPEPRRTAKQASKPHRKHPVLRVTTTIGALIPATAPGYAPPPIDETVPGNAAPTIEGIIAVPVPAAPADPT